MNGKHKEAEKLVSKAAYNSLLKIAEKNGLLGHSGRVNLDTHNTGDADFYEVSVWSVNLALQEAYQAGYADAQKVIAKDLKQDGLKLILPKPQQPTYNYEWKTAEEVIANLHTKLKFHGWGMTTLAKITGTVKPNDYIKAHELWQKLKKAFNAEAAGYKEDDCNSELGSIGGVKNREVMRSSWWAALDGDSYGDYRKLTTIIEALHDGERLRTGVINFGS